MVMILRVVVGVVVRVNMAGGQFKIRAERRSHKKGVRWEGDPRGVGADAISCAGPQCRCRAGPGKHPASCSIAPVISSYPAPPWNCSPGLTGAKAKLKLRK